MTTSNCYNEDCIEGIRNRVESDSIDLIFTDPPYGIQGDKTDQHYNRDSTKVIQGYQDVDQNDYEVFSRRWIDECSRVLRPRWFDLHRIWMVKSTPYPECFTLHQPK